MMTTNQKRQAIFAHPKFVYSYNPDGKHKWYVFTDRQRNFKEAVDFVLGGE